MRNSSPVSIDLSVTPESITLVGKSENYVFELSFTYHLDGAIFSEGTIRDIASGVGRDRQDKIRKGTQRRSKRKKMMSIGTRIKQSEYSVYS